MKTEIRNTSNGIAIDVVNTEITKVRYSKAELEARIAGYTASIDKFTAHRDELQALLNEITEYENKR
jgi:hypothetical protein